MCPKAFDSFSNRFLAVPALGIFPAIQDRGKRIAKCCKQALAQACAVCSPRNRVNERFYGDVSTTIQDAHFVDLVCSVDCAEFSSFLWAVIAPQWIADVHSPPSVVRGWCGFCRTLPDSAERSAVFSFFSESWKGLWISISGFESLGAAKTFQTLTVLRGFQNARWQRGPSSGVSRLLQLRVFCLGFFQDADVGVGVLPESLAPFA